MKKEYLIGGVLGVVLCGIVAYAVITFIGMRNSETAQQLAQRLQQPVPLEVTVSETRQAAQDQSLSKRETGVSASGSSDSNKNNKPKTEGIQGLRIILKSGRVIIADVCREFGTQLRCDVPGGAVEIERQDIESMKEVKIVKRFAVESQPTAGTVAGTDKKDESVKTTAGANVPAQPGNGRFSDTLTPEQIKRLDQIIERKTVLQPEREKLLNEREQLHNDVGKMGLIWQQEQYDGLKKRIEDLEARILGFNDEVKKLNEEEARIFEASSNRQQ